MRIACFFSDRPHKDKQQDMLSACLFSGLVNAFGSTNVLDVPPTDPHYFGGPTYECEWPLYLAAGCLKGKPVTIFPVFDADAFIISTRWLLNSVESGLHTDEEFRLLLAQIDPNHAIVIDSSDNPSNITMNNANNELRAGSCRAFGSRPFITPQTEQLTAQLIPLHISVPLQHIQRMRAAHIGPSPWKTPLIFAAWNDNHQFRRDVMTQLGRSNLPNAELWWGSASQYEIAGTTRPQSPPIYYETMDSSTICISCRGGNPDCLRTSEILSLGKLLISDDPEWDPPLVDGIHYLRARTPEELVNQCWKAIDNPRDASDISRCGHEFFLREHSCEQQVFRLLQKAGLL